MKEFHGEADRIVGVLELPSGPSRRTAAAELEPAPFGDSPVDRRRTPRNVARISGQVNEPPPLLMPESSGYQRGGFLRRMRWAALILVTVGAGYMASQMGRSSNYAFQGELVPARSGDSTPVLSEEERSPAAANSGGESLQVAAKAVPPAESKAPAAVPRRVAPRPQARAAPSSPSSARSPRRIGSMRAPASLPQAPLPRPPRTPTGRTRRTPKSPPRRAPASDADVREEAALALRELDRERQVERADAATAALDSARRRDAMARQAAAAAPLPALRSSAPASISVSGSTRRPSSWAGRCT